MHIFTEDQEDSWMKYKYNISDDGDPKTLQIALRIRSSESFVFDCYMGQLLKFMKNILKILFYLKMF